MRAGALCLGDGAAVSSKRRKGSGETEEERRVGESRHTLKYVEIRLHTVGIDFTRTF
jgi:hypothetical protein